MDEQQKLTQFSKNMTNVGVVRGNINIYNNTVNNKVLKSDSVIENTGGIDAKDTKIKGISADTRKRYITDEPKSRYLLSEYPSEAEFEFYPDKFYIMTFYFITLHCGKEYYVLLEYGSYSDDKYNDFWTIPRTVALLDWAQVKKVGEIRSLYDKAMKNETVSKQLEYLKTNFFYNYGIFFCDEAEDENFVVPHIEYKLSVTNVDKWRCYKIINKFISNIESVGVRNIADPECRHNRIFLPLSQIEKLPRVSKGFVGIAPENGWYSFMGRLIPENIADTLINARDKLLQNTTRVNSEDLVFRSRGVLFKIAVSNAHEYFMSSADRRKIDRQVTDVFEKIMLRFNIIHYALDGYQITGAISTNTSNDTVDFTEILDYAYQELKRFVFRHEIKLFLRCTVLSGEYEYGKILGPYSRIPRFAGADYERLRILSHKARTIQYKIASKSNGILFVHSAEDIGLIYFSPKEEYNVHVDDEEPSLMYCIIDRV